MVVGGDQHTQGRHFVTQVEKHTYNPGQNIRDKIKKSSKAGQEKKI